MYLNQFNASSIDVMLYCFVEVPDWSVELQARHRLFVDVVRLAHRLGVEFAFPTRTLHVASAPPELAGARPAPEPRPGPAADEDAVRLGRAEAEAIVQAQWPGDPQPPVSFGDPDRIPPAPGQGAEKG